MYNWDKPHEPQGQDNNRPELADLILWDGKRIINAFWSEPDEPPKPYKTDLIVEKHGNIPNNPETVIQLIVDANRLMTQSPHMAPNVAYRIIEARTTYQ